MTENESYYTIEKEAQAEFTDRGSRFIAYAFPVSSPEAFKLKLKELKEAHPKANHHCFAYRMGTEGLVFRVSDDGEPSGTAGRPILGQIDSRKVVNTAIVVVRYFGGTLLGVPGLINAYKTVAALVLQVTPVVQKQLQINYRIDLPYNRLNDVLQVLKQTQSTVLSQELQLFCFIECGIPKNRLTEVKYRLEQFSDVEFRPLA